MPDEGRNRELVVVGAHGGAGTTTLAALLRPAWDMGTISDLLEPGRPPVQPKGRPLVLVTRNSVAAAQRATRAVTAIDATRDTSSAHLAALVIVGDGAGPEPRDATARFALLEGRVRELVRMPFVPALRLVDDPTQVRLPRKVEGVLNRILDVALAHPCH
ncbi:hypothetical protein [Spirillospora sp. CA-294931]|uniref:hypothetical protein n=1 Tax=Spirillospora sp. CA-294931 TaxID=3240042 RepID=UPI003D8F5FB3